MKLEITRGNLKLPKTTAIFNPGGPAKDCVSAALGLCQMAALGVRCYALKAETQYPASYPFRVRQGDYWLKATAEKFITDFLRIVDKARTPITHLRLNEAGDFRHVADVEKAATVAEKLAAEGIRTYCYTARSDIWDNGGFDCADYLIVNGSNFMADNKFTAVESIPAGAIACAGDCRKCSLCTEANGLEIFVQTH